MPGEGFWDADGLEAAVVELEVPQARDAGEADHRRTANRDSTVLVASNIQVRNGSWKTAR